MIGKLLSAVVKTVTLPIDVVEGVFDVLAGGDGSKKSRSQADMPLSEIRDGICKAIKSVDED